MHGDSQLAAMFGPLEVRVLDALWARGNPACVRDLQPDFPGIAYTTLMTTLDRLHRKGTLSRVKQGRAFYYQPVATRDELIVRLAGTTFANVLRDHSALRPVLSQFVETVTNRDRAALDELEALVRERKKALS
jgi:predicted transcriptional regulator